MRDTYLASSQQFAQYCPFCRGHLDGRGCAGGNRDDLFVSHLSSPSTHDGEQLSCKRNVLCCGSNESGVMVKGNDIEIIATSLIDQPPTRLVCVFSLQI
jgi:hypothetical protein